MNLPSFLVDPTSEECLNFWKESSYVNTAIFRDFSTHGQTITEDQRRYIATEGEESEMGDEAKERLESVKGPLLICFGFPFRGRGYCSPIPFYTIVTPRLLINNKRSLMS